MITTIRGRKVISREAESELASIAKLHGGLLGDIPNPHSKVRTIMVDRNRREETICYMRHTGLGKGLLQVAIRPQLGRDVDAAVLSVPGVSPHLNKNFPKNPRLVFNSNFSAYKNKGDEPSRGEHFGWCYSLNVSEGFESFDQFMSEFIGTCP
ncbi:hypothetical protein OAA46_01270 [bacterium]|nr:hypothetical protein [bacterium]